jgi:bifunctional UDP-N-acetylglucosamine pyrophosphorylase / glucosamine-1-phosphate N-acetyltransferase
MKTNALILAAGLGTRMKSKHSKALQPLSGQYMIDHVLDMIDEVGFSKKVAVVGYEKEAVIAAIEKRDVLFAHQDERLGTGHAAMMAKEFIDDDESVIVFNCDTPMLSAELIRSFIEFHRFGGYKASLITTKLHNPHGYGRIIRDDNNCVSKIVEEKDADYAEKQINEINSGIYVFSGKELKESLDKLKNDNAQNEYYLTDCIEIIKKSGEEIGGFICEDSNQLIGINTKLQLAEVEMLIREKTTNALMLEGVTIPSPASVFIDKNVKIGRDTVILPGSHIKGYTVIGEDCVIGPNAVLTDMVVGNGVTIENSTLMKSEVDDSTCVGPYAYVRPGSKIGKMVKIGDFVEVKNSVIGDGTKISHLSYIGDGDVGSGVNIGCGAVFVNYNGKEKFRTVVKDGAFIGCNSNLIAPVTVEEKGYVAAGSTITDSVPANALAVARQRQRNIEGWVEKKGILNKK